MLNKSSEALHSHISKRIYLLPEPLGSIARLWSAGKKAEARALLLREKEKLHFFVGSDRWKHPPHPLESSPGAPLLGPFWRVSEYRGQHFLALRYREPEFLQFLIDELHWSEPPF